eukprot:CAMPEP_0198569222 /NCGR_PEP_ID=MMETSP1462-20131121/107512_1 /TAXON_ID=1333877 /ORGANISM="Brandtodinium nutriculum, Strain RCC3387" /LENGTH=73 /DNA_ID=CAMNT_0044300309 /DNA_START=30 /DNA_END=251 /DNA_ORIENTATION=-
MPQATCKGVLRLGKPASAKARGCRTSTSTRSANNRSTASTSSAIAAKCIAKCNVDLRPMSPSEHACQCKKSFR